jgi:hypothetical protein
MANYSIPNSTPAIGRISTPLSRQSRKQNNSAARQGPVSLKAVAEPGASRPFNPQRSIQRVGRWMLNRLLAKASGIERLLAIYPSWAFSFYWRVKGAWWSSRSSKPLSVPRTGTEVGSIPILSASTSLVILSGSRRRGRNRRIPWQYRKIIHRDYSTSLGMTNTTKEVTEHVA